MILIPYSFAGTLLNDSNYETWLPGELADLQAQAQLGYVKRAGAPPVFAGKDFQPHALSLSIKCLGDYQEQFEDINELFNVYDETPRAFICTDNGDTDSQWFVHATTKSVMGGHDGPVATVTLALDDPVWQSANQNTHTFTTTNASDTTDVTNSGNIEAYPLIELTPTSNPSTDFIYSVYLQVLPQSTNPWNNRPLCITGATDTTFDTAALVAAGKMQADGDDLRVFRNGNPQNFWVSGINTTDTKVWVVANMPEARNMVLKTAIGATDTVTEIEVNYTTAALTAIQAMPNAGYLILDTSIGSTDSEEFLYTAKTINDTKLAFTVGTRAYRNTTALDHAAGSNVRHQPYAYRIDYGAASATAPTIDDTTKPIINLSTSNNASFVYSQFYEQTALRAGIWEPSVVRQADPLLSRSTFFTSTNDEGDTDPASAMGLKAQTYEAGGLWRPDSPIIRWTGNFPDYVTSFSASGEQTQNSASWLSFGMGYLGVNGFINYFWLVSAQATTDFATWTTWTKATTDAVVPPSLTQLRFAMQGSILGSADVYAKADVTAATVNMTNYPHVMIRSEKSSIAKINCRITNQTTGHAFTLTIPVETNDTITIDTDPDFPYVKHNGQLVNGTIKVNSIRSAWLALQPGANTILFENLQSVANDYTINIKHRTRMNFF